MKQYVVDQLRLADELRVREFLERRYGPPDLGSIFWVPLAETLLSPLQSAHRDCRPHCAAIELEGGRLSLELLIRSRNRLRCACIGYASPAQRDWLIGQVDAMLEELTISV